MKIYKTLYLTILFFALFFAKAIEADIVEMKDGNIFNGKIITETKTELHLFNSYGDFELKKKDIITQVVTHSGKEDAAFYKKKGIKFQADLINKNYDAGDKELHKNDKKNGANDSVKKDEQSVYISGFGGVRLPGFDGRSNVKPGIKFDIAAGIKSPFSENFYIGIRAGYSKLQFKDRLGVETDETIIPFALSPRYYMTITNSLFVPYLSAAIGAAELKYANNRMPDPINELRPILAPGIGLESRHLGHIIFNLEIEYDFLFASAKIESFINANLGVGYRF